MSLTQCDEHKAREYLKRNHWSINYALNDYYDTEIGHFVEGSADHKVLPEEYSVELITLYAKYASESGEVIESDGLIRLIEDLGYSLDDLVTICLAKLLGCTNISKGITKGNFLYNCYEHRCSSLLQIRHILEDMDAKLENDVGYFTRIYKYTFDLVVEPDKRHLDEETATEYWKLFFQARYPIHIDNILLSTWISFLQEERKSFISKDCWQMLIEFFKRYSSLSAIKTDYNEADPWPYIIDEFYEYLQDKKLI